MSYDLNVRCADVKNTAVDFRFISLLTSCIQGIQNMIKMTLHKDNSSVDYTNLLILALIICRWVYLYCFEHRPY